MVRFAGFFRALWDRDPFPWQDSLAARVLEGDWPKIGLPTASGKTALIDIAVFALAMRAPGAARRIFFVVDRRVIADEAAERAAEIATKLREAPPDSELAGVAQRLRDLGGDVPLETAVLRGGIPRDDFWADSPLQPIVVCSTVDQIGSSVLFRSYGGSEYGRPIRAGLAANDSLILLDEAHTSRAFAETVASVQRYRDWASEPLALAFTVVEMSATPGSDSLRESHLDLENSILKRRWTASKRARLVAVEPKHGEEAVNGGFSGLVEGLAQEARRLRDQRGATVIGVIANRVGTARQVHQALTNEVGCDAILLIGRSRPYDRDRIWREWRGRIGLNRGTEPDRPVFVVATQCIEVGANLDFDGLVTELASIDALEQRFGRLDRDGIRAAATGATHGAIVAQKDQTAKRHEDALYGNAMAATWAWLTDHVSVVTRAEEEPREGKKSKFRKTREQFVEMGVRSLRAALSTTPNRESLTMPAPSAPVLMPAHVDLLCQTSPEPTLSPDISVYLHGPEAGPADINVLWRADLEGDPAGWLDLVTVCPPAEGEMTAVPFYAVRQWLSRGSATDVSDVEGSVEGFRRKTTWAIEPVLWWRGADESEVIDRSEALRPGMTIVVPAGFGGCDEWGWNPAVKHEVRDIGDAVKLLVGRPTLRLRQKLASQWNYGPLAELLRSAEAPELPREDMLDNAADPWIAETLKHFRTAKLKWFPDPQNPDQYCAVLSRAVFDQNDVRGSYGSVEIPLEEHLKNCSSVAAEFAAGLPERLQRTVARALALHDAGKADPRFQAWLRGGNPVRQDELLAKSQRNGQNRAAIERARKAAGYPRGGRHELMSAALLLARGDDHEDLDRELLLHLVASHHGRCRPFAPVVADDDPVTVEYAGVSAWSAHGLDRVGSGISERFWRLTRRYGWYGLVYLEALVRLADHRQSEREQSRSAKAAHA